MTARSFRTMVCVLGVALTAWISSAAPCGGQASQPRPQAPPPTATDSVYITDGGMIYHRRDCPSIKDQDVAEVDGASMRNMERAGRRLLPCSICNPVEPKRPRPVERDEPTDISFVTSARMIVRQEPSLTAPVVGKLGALEVLMVIRVMPGWLRIATTGGASEADAVKGWIAVRPGDMESLIAENWLSIKGRTVTLSRSVPFSTRLAVLRGRVKVGFTESQVIQALWAPLSITSIETAAGVKRSMVYPGRVIEVQGGKVVAILTTDIIGK